MNIKFRLTLGAIASFAATLMATEALQEVQPTGYAGLNYAETGFCFQPVTNFTVTRLGYRFDPGEDPSAYVVRLVNAAGLELASVTLNAAAAPTNQMIYTNIPPLELEAGSTNYLLSYDQFYLTAHGSNLWDGALIIADDPGTGSFTVAEEIAYLGACISTNLVDPTNAANFLFVGPNLEFTTAPIVNPSYLTISLTPSNTVRLIWPASDTLGTLQSGTNFPEFTVTVTNTSVVVGTNNVVELPLVPPRAFFRLSYP